MLRISKIKESKYIHGEKVIHYPFELKLGNRKINLNENWSSLKFTKPKSLEIGNYIVPKMISQNFYQYLTLDKIYQDRCLYFSKFLINSDNYHKFKIEQNQIVSFVQIIKFFQIQNDSPFFVHAAVSLGNGFFLSKLGYMGLYVQGVNDILNYYQIDNPNLKVCYASKLFTFENPKFYENLNIPNTFHENEK